MVDEIETTKNRCPRRGGARNSPRNGPPENATMSPRKPERSTQACGTLGFSLTTLIILVLNTPPKHP